MNHQICLHVIKPTPSTAGMRSKNARTVHGSVEPGDKRAQSPVDQSKSDLTFLLVYILDPSACKAAGPLYHWYVHVFDCSVRLFGSQHFRAVCDTIDLAHIRFERPTKFTIAPSMCRMERIDAAFVCVCVCHARQFPASNGNFARGNYQNMCILNAPYYAAIDWPRVPPRTHRSRQIHFCPHPNDSNSLLQFELGTTAISTAHTNLPIAEQNQKAPAFSLCDVTCDSAVRKHGEHFVMVVIGVFVVCLMSGFKLPSNPSLSLCVRGITHMCIDNRNLINIRPNADSAAVR